MARAALTSVALVLILRRRRYFPSRRRLGLQGSAPGGGRISATLPCAAPLLRRPICLRARRSASAYAPSRWPPALHHRRCSGPYRARKEPAPLAFSRGTGLWAHACLPSELSLRRGCPCVLINVPAHLGRQWRKSCRWHWPSAGSATEVLALGGAPGLPSDRSCSLYNALPVRESPRIPARVTCWPASTRSTTQAQASDRQYPGEPVVLPPLCPGPMDRVFPVRAGDPRALVHASPRSYTSGRRTCLASGEACPGPLGGLLLTALLFLGSRALRRP